MTSSLPPPAAKALTLLQTYAGPLLTHLTNATPHIISYSQKAYTYYQTLPQDYLNLSIGFIFCFLGGIYPTIFAAIEAAKHGGFESLRENLQILANEALVIVEASKKDDDLDEDKDGTKDVEQIEGTELIMRKMKLVLTKMNPQKVDKALAALYNVWLSILAVLSMQFAKTIALSLSISNFLKIPVNRYLSPLLQELTPDEYDKWVPILLGWIAKSIAISLAWYIQTILSAIASAMTGALILSRVLLKVSYEKGWTLGGLVTKDEKDTSVDEVLAYGFAFVGFYVQWSMGFSVGFPLNLVLFPFGCCEMFLRWSITN